jgi:hypothetical protein
MNKRIQKLAQQTDIWCDQNHAGDEFYHLRWEEKFALLIVQECIDIISPYTISMSRIGEEYLHPIQEIKNNFGVGDEPTKIYSPGESVMSEQEELRYAAFAWEINYPRGGAMDFIGRYATVEDANDALSGLGLNWYQIVDTETFRVVEEGQI